MVTLCDDLRSGELALSVSADDLSYMAMGQGRKVYLDPNEFFALTYATFNLWEMVTDVLLRPLGENYKVRRRPTLTVIVCDPVRPR